MDSSQNNMGALVSASGRGLLDVSFGDPNRVSTTFKVGEIWSVARDGSTGLDAKARKKLWTRLKREVIYRDTPEDVERKAREAELARTLAYRATEEYKERVAVDVAQASLRAADKAKDANLERATLDEDLSRRCNATFVDESESDDDSEEEEDVSGVPSRNDMFLAKVHTAQRVMAQLRPGSVQADLPKGLHIDVRDAATTAVADFLAANPDRVPFKDNEKTKKPDDDDDDRDERHRSRRHRRDADDEDDEDRRRRRHRDRSSRDRHRRRRRDDYHRHRYRDDDRSPR